jgi:ketosteroid isomerase-like protein
VRSAGLRALAAACAVIGALSLLAGSTHARGGASMATTPGDVEARNRAAVEASFAAWRDGTGSPYDLLAADAQWTIVGRSEVSRTYGSRAAFLEQVIGPFNARMRERLRPTIRRLYTDADTVIVFFDASGIARDGELYANTYAWFLEMRDGQVVAAHAFFDSVTFNDLWRRVPPADRDR